MTSTAALDRFESLLDRMDVLLSKLGNDSKPQDQRTEKYRSVLQKTVDALERTKSSFKSKQLKELREEIEDVLQHQ